VTHALPDAAAEAAPTIGFDDFLKVDIRIGTIVAAVPFPEARKPALKLEIEFGPVIGRKRSSAQITQHYECASLVGRQVAAVVNFPPRQIGKFLSEVLTLGFPDATGQVVLFAPDHGVADGARMF
jgi:tRNA-binding protein